MRAHGEGLRTAADEQSSPGNCQPGLGVPGGRWKWRAVPFEGQGLIGVAHAHLPGLPCHPLAGCQGVSLVSTCTGRSISGRFWTDHLVTPPSSTWQQITTTTALAHHRFNRDQAPSQGLLPRRCLSPPHGPVCRRGGGLQGRRRGPSTALCPGSGLRPRAPWGSMGPPPEPHDTPKDSLQPHPPGWAALLSL